MLEISTSENYVFNVKLCYSRLEIITKKKTNKETKKKPKTSIQNYSQLDTNAIKRNPVTTADGWTFWEIHTFLSNKQLEEALTNVSEPPER